MTETFGDKDMLDVWDDGDPVDAKLDVLERLVTALKSDDTFRQARALDGLRLIVKLDAAIAPGGHRRRRWTRIRKALEELAGYE
jgi:hypothetical protein